MSSLLQSLMKTLFTDLMEMVVIYLRMSGTYVNVFNNLIKSVKVQKMHQLCVIR